MSAEDVGRAQDQGRKHRRRSAPSAATASLLAAYQDAMRDELRGLLSEIRGREPEPGLGLVAQPERVRPSLGDRQRLWDLAIKIGRELGTEVDATPVGGQTAPTVGAPRRRRAIDFGGQ